MTADPGVSGSDLGGDAELRRLTGAEGTAVLESRDEDVGADGTASEVEVEGVTGAVAFATSHCDVSVRSLQRD